MTFRELLMLACGFMFGVAALTATLAVTKGKHHHQLHADHRSHIIVKPCTITHQLRSGARYERTNQRLEHGHLRAMQSAGRLDAPAEGEAVLLHPLLRPRCAYIAEKK